MLLRSAPSWLPSRTGYLGASELIHAADVTKTGKPSAAYQKLLRDKVAERLTGFKASNYVTPAMQRGIDNQATAAKVYASRKGVIVGPEATVGHPQIEYFVATPDGYLDTDGLLEIKVPLPSTYFEWVYAGEVPDCHKLQMVGQIACTRREWVDFVAYCPEAPPGKDLFVRRFAPTAEQIAEVERIASDFLARVEEMFDAIKHMEMIG